MTDFASTATLELWTTLPSMGRVVAETQLRRPGGVKS